MYRNLFCSRNMPETYAGLESDCHTSHMSSNCLQNLQQIPESDTLNVNNSPQLDRLHSSRTLQLNHQHPAQAYLDLLQTDLRPVSIEQILDFFI